MRPDFHYHAPGNANLRAFRADLGGRWAVGVNIEGTKPLYGGTALEGFLDLGVVDTLAVPSAPAGKSYTTLYDGGVGIVAHRQVRDLPVTLRLEFPLVVNRWNYAADWNGRNQGPLAFRWQVSLESSF